MSPELSKALRDSYPIIFADKPIFGGSPSDPDEAAVQSSFTTWCFECGDGWFDLLDLLCANLQNATANGAPQVVATQVKEKFGTLRFYANDFNDEQEGMIEMAEAMSGRICEVCGDRGKTIRSGWIKTRCPTHEHV